MYIIEDKNIEYDMVYPIGKNIKNMLSYTDVFLKHILEIVPKDVRLNFLCRGSSGAILAGIIASQIPKEYETIINHVKKPGESSHSGDLRLKNEDFNIIIDDFISSGETVSSIYNDFKKAGGTEINLLVVSGRVSLNKNIDFVDYLEYVICGNVCEDFIKRHNAKVKTITLTN